MARSSRGGGGGSRSSSSSSSRSRGISGGMKSSGRSSSSSSRSSLGSSRSSIGSSGNNLGSNRSNIGIPDLNKTGLGSHNRNKSNVNINIGNTRPRYNPGGLVNTNINIGGNKQTNYSRPNEHPRPVSDNYDNRNQNYNNQNSNYQRPNNSHSQNSNYHRPNNNQNQNSNYQRPNNNQSYNNNNQNKSSVMKAIMIMMSIVMFILITNMTIKAVSVDITSTETKSTIKREKLESGLVKETDYFTDTLGWIKSPRKIEEGMRYFYKETGVQPHALIIDNMYGDSNPGPEISDKYLNEQYDKLFDDEAHVLLVFLDNGNDVGYWAISGDLTRTVMDDEARDILLDYTDRYAFSDLGEEEMFSIIFTRTADSIMREYKSPWIKVVITAIVFIATLLITYIVGNTIVKRREQELIENQQNLDILNTPLEKIKTNDLADDLAQQYSRD